MRRILALLFICVILVNGTHVSAMSSMESRDLDKVELSSLKESECMEILSDLGVEFPQKSQNDIGDSGLMRIIAELEIDPEKEYIINNTKAADLIEDIRRAVKQYYGLSTIIE